MEIDFFVSSDDDDMPWAEWIAWTLESFGYSVFALLRDMEFSADRYYQKLHDALNESKIFIAVYSQNYAHSDRWPSEWHTAYVKDPLGEKGLFIPVRIEAVKKEGLLVPFPSVDIFGLSEEQARTKLKNTVLKALDQGRGEISPKKAKPPFPGEFKKIEDAPREDRVLDENAAAEFLAARTKQTTNSASALLAKRLGFSSERLGNAARYINENSISYGECIEILDENGDDVFDEWVKT
jgi:hypothetical protein